jgi:hypothetical protein
LKKDKRGFTMKNFYLFILTLGLISASDYKFDINLSAKVSGGSWLINWNQNDDTALENANIKNEFNIDAIPTKNISLTLLGNYTFENPIYSLENEEIKSEIKLLEGSKDDVNFDSIFWLIQLTGKVLTVSYEYYYFQADGNSFGYDATNPTQYGYVNFNTDAELNTLFLSYSGFPYFALGYKKTSKTVPQSSYISDGSSSSAGLIDPNFKWNVDYFLAKIELSKAKLTENIYFNGNLQYGIGKTNPSSDTVSDADLENKLKEGDAESYSFDLNLEYKTDKFGGKVGYRYIYEQLKTGKSDDLHIFGESKSTFNGLYFHLSYIFNLI